MSEPRPFPKPQSGLVVPRFGGIATFMRLPCFEDPSEVDIGLVGVPWDGGTTNRPGARHGPRQMREMSTLMRRVHHVSGIAPYELARTQRTALPTCSDAVKILPTGTNPFSLWRPMASRPASWARPSSARRSLEVSCLTIPEV